MDDLILSIKPIYVKEIFNGKKKYEFRKFKPKRDIEKIYIYETAPTKKIIGYFKYEGLIVDCKYKVWNLFHDNAGISEEDYFLYYNNCEQAYAYKIGEFIKFSNPIDPYKIVEGFVAPQSYRYVKRGIFDGIICNLV